MWQAGKQHGVGVYISPNGKRREGEWNAGKLTHWIVSVEMEDEQNENENEENEEEELGNDMLLVAADEEVSNDQNNRGDQQQKMMFGSPAVPLSLLNDGNKASDD